MARTRLTKEARKELILQAAFQVISEKGFKSTTTRAVAEAAGVNEALLFQHFPTKRKLLEAVIAEIVNRQPVPIDKGLDDTEAGFFQKLSSFENFFLELNLYHPENLKVIMYSVLEDFPMPAEFDPAKEGTFLRWFYDSIAKGKREWGFNPAIDPAVALSMFLGGMIYFVLQRIKSGRIVKNESGFTELFAKMIK